ncbi:alpha/beta hydrolase [Actinopolyspora halophila]|uniref:alpha/beta hydrolase n=1 Tax=Actinopolyspora halophila TaxID=1850 RepID=UPI000360FABB|nr:alpha/beta hydrolase [Actinopolyspora halophila]
MPRIIGRACAVLLLLVVAGCSAGPSDRPAVAYRGSEQQVPPDRGTPQQQPVPPLGPRSQDALGWRDCTATTKNELGEADVPDGTRFSCTHLNTSLSPTGTRRRGTMQLSLLGVGTGKIPLVVVNDVRGEQGTTFAARLALHLPERMLREYTVIGMDRRGTGESDAANCVPAQNRETITGFDPRATEKSELDELNDSIRSASKECLLELEQRAQAYDTRRAADDLEELRIELGVPRLHAIGRGEGSRVLTTYAQQHPGSVGRTVLDGAPDPVLESLARTKQQARSAERTFDAFASACGDSGNCPLGDDPRALLDGLVERARADGLPTADEPLRSGELIRAVLHGLTDRGSWPHLETALAAADDGDASELAVFVRSPDPDVNRLDARMITRCNDTMLRLPPERATDVAREWADSLPLFGGMFAQRLVQCSLWPRPQEALPAPESGELPPVPVISTKHDPLTPAEGSKNMAGRLSSGIAVNWLGSGHGALGESDCVTRLVGRFFTDGEVPPEGTACPA